MKVIEVRQVVVRMLCAFRPPAGLSSRICRVRVLFPDIGKHPVLESLAIERYHPDEEITDFPTAGELLEQLTGLTMFQQ